MAEIRLQQVSKSFAATRAVSEMSLQVAKGEFVVLLGPTGAGKTTTLRLVAGLEKPDSGQVLIGGNDVTSADPASRDVSFVFQQYSLYPHYSVYQNLAFPLRAPGRRYGKADIDRRVREIAELLRIESKLNNRATELSGGEMQRVSIGRALVREPSVYLMDEPLSSLDAKLREDLRVELKRIQRDLGATVLYVTHDQLEAMTLADRIGVLEDGRLAQIDSPRQVYERPANIYAAKRLGSPQINLLPTGLLGLSGAHQDAATFGLRPEDVLIHPTGSDTGSPARALTVEHLGVETVALFETDSGQQLHALIDAASPLREGDQVLLSGRHDKIIAFDSDGNLLNV